MCLRGSKFDANLCPYGVNIQCKSTDDAKTQTDSNLSFLKTRIDAIMSQQAQAMIEAQYGGRVQIYSVVQV